MSIKELIGEARNLHLDIPEAVIEKLGLFLSSELNMSELGPVSLKKICSELLDTHLKTSESNEN